MKNVTIQNLNFKGQGEYFDREEDKKYLVWNALPGEQIEAEIIKKRRGQRHCIAKTIISPSPFRIEPKELDHYIACSPWQIMSFDYENQMKVETFNNLIKSKCEGLIQPCETIYHDQQIFGYRNKLEFSIYAFADERLSLAFHTRATKRGKIPIQACELAMPCLNDTAVRILELLNHNKIHARNLKTIIVRSNTAGQTIAAVFVKDELIFEKLIVSLNELLNKDLIGIVIYWSNPKSPASTPDKILTSVGKLELEENISGIRLSYGINSFFQSNIKIFETALKHIDINLEPGSEVVDLFSGVGTISCVLNSKTSHCFQIESNPESTNFARQNIQQNNLRNFEVMNIPSEKAEFNLGEESTLILDPPRSGLHPDLIEKILRFKPKKMIYLSCNPETQISDIMSLAEKYKCTDSSIYNFFPRTPHIETLCILERKK